MKKQTGKRRWFFLAILLLSSCSRYITFDRNEEVVEKEVWRVLSFEDSLGVDHPFPSTSTYYLFLQKRSYRIKKQRGAFDPDNSLCYGTGYFVNKIKDPKRRQEEDEREDCYCVFSYRIVGQEKKGLIRSEFYDDNIVHCQMWDDTTGLAFMVHLLLNSRASYEIQKDTLTICTGDYAEIRDEKDSEEVVRLKMVLLRDAIGREQLKRW